MSMDSMIVGQEKERQELWWNNLRPMAESLEKAIARLEERIQHVLLPEAPMTADENPVAEDPVRSEPHRKVIEHCDDLQRFIRNIEYIISRVVL